MNNSIKKLQKFFRLEAQRGYDNRAVMGGLADMLEPWIEEAANDGLNPELIDAVVARIRDYSRLSPDSRREALRGLWRRIVREVDGAQDIQTEEEVPGDETRERPEPSVDEDTGDQASVRETPSREPEASEIPAKPVQKKSYWKPRIPIEGNPAALDADVTVLSGVGPKNAEYMSKLGINTLEDMLYHFPRRYDDYSKFKTIKELKYDEEVTIIGSVKRVGSRKLHGGKRSLTEVILEDGTAAVRLNWFNQPWLEKSIKAGQQMVVSGKVNQYLGRFVFNNPDWEPLEAENLHTNRIVPVYPLTAGITQKNLRQLMNKVVSYWAPRVYDPLPDGVRKNIDLMTFADALTQVHFPDSFDELQAAQFRLGFEEIFYLQLGIHQRRLQWQSREGRVFPVEDEWLENEKSKLPYTLTNAQAKAIEQIRADLASGRPMNRLLQGDVGSGKTVAAALAAKMVLSHGAQAAVLAPTSILAEQHFNSFRSFLAEIDESISEEQICLLIGSIPEEQKAEIRAGLADGSIRMVIGTHALLEPDIIFNDLQFIVIDEQHRFGVNQRAALREKGSNPHLLVMTATPIPRSLALTLFGDLDLSLIDEMPPGRKPVDTYIIRPKEHERAYTLIKKQIELGHQAFIIYPLVEESENSESKAAVEEYQKLSEEVFPKQKLALLHGRMKPEEKEDVMSRFRAGEFQILVSTSVIEVGVDIPNATVMVIEGANRFGLAQLHQFRGRVGRNAEKSFCLLIPESADDVENERLKAMVDTNDGFELAERDLQQRGPGQFLGTRQSGFALFRMASITNLKMIETAREQAKSYLENDPNLENEESQPLKTAIEHFWQRGEGDIS